MTEPISAAVAKSHLRLEDDDPGIDRLAGVITAARLNMEERLNVTISNRPRTLTLDGFPGGDGKISLPNGPVLSVTEIAYIDTDGASQTVAAHRLVAYPLSDVLTPVYGESWPSTRDVAGSVTITYQAGMMTGSPLTLDNEAIISGMLLIIGDLWENREEQFVGVTSQVNKTVERLTHFYRRDLGT